MSKRRTIDNWGNSIAFSGYASNNTHVGFWSERVIATVRQCRVPGNPGGATRSSCRSTEASRWSVAFFREGHICIAPALVQPDNTKTPGG